MEVAAPSLVVEVADAAAAPVLEVVAPLVQVEKAAASVLEVEETTAAPLMEVAATVAAAVVPGKPSDQRRLLLRGE